MCVMCVSACVQVTSTDGDWWSGQLNGITGIFPYNYVQPRYESAPPLHTQSTPVETTPTSATPTQGDVQDSVTSLVKPIVAKVIVAFQAQKDGQLSLLPGDLVKVTHIHTPSNIGLYDDVTVAMTMSLLPWLQVLKQAGNGWWEGELQARGRQRTRGWFPANRVEPLGPKKTNSSVSLPVRAKSVSAHSLSCV